MIFGYVDSMLIATKNAEYRMNIARAKMSQRAMAVALVKN
jgi:hypothetical protein